MLQHMVSQGASQFNAVSPLPLRRAEPGNVAQWTDKDVLGLGVGPLRYSNTPAVVVRLSAVVPDDYGRFQQALRDNAK